MMTRFFSNCVNYGTCTIKKKQISLYILIKKTYREGQYKYKESKYNILTKMIFLGGECFTKTSLNLNQPESNT